MTEGAIRPTEVVGFAFALAIYETILVGAYVVVFRPEALPTLLTDSLTTSATTFLALPDVLAVALVAAALAGTSVFVDEDTSIYDLFGPNSPSGVRYGFAVVHVAISVVVGTTLFAALGVILSLVALHPQSVASSETARPGLVLDAVLTHPDAVVGGIIGGLLGLRQGLLGLPSYGSSTGGSAGGAGDADGE